MQTTLWILVLLAIVLVIAFKVVRLRRVIVFEYQRGLKYSNGRFREVVGAGRYWLMPSSHISPVDIRPNLVTIPGQEVITTDGVTVKISLLAQYEVADPVTAINKNANYQQAFYLLLQMAIRQVVHGEKVDALIENRTSFNERIVGATKEKVSSLGLRLLFAEVKDVMLPGDLRKTFAQMVKAQKEGQAVLERARGETAALRSLANAAKMAEDNPNLLQLRALQVMADSTGNTIMLGVPGAAPIKPAKNGGGSKESIQE